MAYTYSIELVSVLLIQADDHQHRFYTGSRNDTDLNGSTLSNFSKGLQGNLRNMSANRLSASMRCFFASSNENVSFAGSSATAFDEVGVGIPCRGYADAGSEWPSATAELANLTAALLASFFFLLDALVTSDDALRLVTRVAFVNGAVGAAGVLATTAAVAVAVLAARVAERVTGIGSTTNVGFLRTPNSVLSLSLSLDASFFQSKDAARSIYSCCS